MNDMVTQNYTLLHTLKLTVLKDKSSMYTEGNFFSCLLGRWRKQKEKKRS